MMRSLTHAGRLLLATTSAYFAVSLAQAQTLTVSGTTTLPADTVATYASITVQSGGTLDLGGGSAITVTGALTIDAGGTVLCRSKDITTQVAGAWAGTGVTIHAGSVSIAATGLLSADGQGYANGIGPGFPVGLSTNTAYRTGASHGGAGTGTGAVAGYGSSLEPSTPGTGAAFYDNEQTAGGGAIRLIVEGTLTLNGEITADGTGTPAASAVFHGGASGGSIWVTAGALAGAGFFSADARSASYNTAVTTYGQSSGGRIAIYAGSADGFTGWTLTTASAGGGTAQVGTQVFAVGAPGAQAMRILTRAEFPQDTVLTLQSLTLEAAATLDIGGGGALTISGALTLGDNAIVLCRGKNTTAQIDGAWAGAGVSIRAASATIPATAKITADGQGYGTGTGPGTAIGLPVATAYTTGASHGGTASGTGAASAYGSSLQPTTPGSGSASHDTEVTAGGGVIRLIVDGMLTLDGEITADGTGSLPGGNISHGGATGGSIWATVATLAGAGKFTADAMRSVSGNNYSTTNGNSSGGHIAVYYRSASGFGGFAPSSVAAGNTVAENGTLAFIDESVAGGGTLRVTSRMTLDQGPIASYQELTVENGATLVVGGGVALDVAGTLALGPDTTLRMLSKDNTAQVDGAWVGSGGLIVAGDLVVAAGSKITADGEGYRNGAGLGFPSVLPASSAYLTGASYGGWGKGTGALAPFGSPLEPVALGTGAAISNDEQTAGGGALRIIVEGALTLDGEISADGVATTPGFQVGHGGATGGSIWVTTSTLTGSGRFTADAYPAVTINIFRSTGQSSGGRIGIHYQTAAGFTGFSASSAASSEGDGEPGTVLFSARNGEQIDARCFTRLDVLEGRSLALHSLTLEAGAVLDLFGGSTLEVASLLDVKEDAVVNFLSRNQLAQFGGAWIGEGARIDAGDMRVAANALLSADSQGYRDAGGPGGPNAIQTQSTGGSYGGRGSGANAKAPYGSLVAPRDLGSAGGYGQNAAHQNTFNIAGGAVFLNVARSLQFDGKISAIGSSGDTLHGGATGGSVLIRATTLTGTGRIDASAVSGSSSASSGGRIAIWAESNTMPASLITVASSGPAAQPGTVHFADANAIAWLGSVNNLFTGPTRLEWITLGSGASQVGVDVVAQPTSGAALSLATGLAVDAGFFWDTTTVADGVYTLTVRKRDSRAGTILGSDTRTVTVVNDSLVLRGTLNANVTIPAGKVTYVLGEVTIPGGVTVTVEPGAIVKVSLGGSFVVETGGSLVANGTLALPIVFTSLLDDTVGGDSNFDGNASTPGTVDWIGLRSLGGTYTFNEYFEARHAVDVVNREIATNIRWRTGSLHLIERQIDIVPGGTLTIEAGAIVKFAQGVGLRVIGGALHTEGTQLRPVVFTSARDDSVGGDSNGDGSTTMPVAGDWYGIYFKDTTSTLRHTHFTYGGESAARFRGMFDIQTASVTFDSCMFTDILFEAAYLQPDQGGSATFNNCVFSRVDRGIFANRGATATVRNCVFDSNRRALHYSGGRIDVTNSAITNSLNWGVIVDGGSAITDFFNNAFWNPRATGGTVTGATIAIGANGVIEGDPKFVDRGALDFRVLAGSALIDAGNAAHDAPADFRGFARLGTAPEIGAFEFTTPHPSTVDLQAEVSAATTAAVCGTEIELSITVRNTGTASVTGPWRHAIFLRPADGSPDVPVTEFVDRPAGVLAAGGATNLTVRATVPEGLVGLHRWGITVNGREDLFEGANLANNTSIASAVVALDVPELPFGGSVTGRFFRSGESRVYKVRAADPGQTIHLLGDTEPTRGFTQLLAARGSVPTTNDFDVQSAQWDLPDATLSIPDSADDWYYVRIRASELRVPTTTFTLAARAVEFQLTGLGLNLVATGPVTIPVLGTDLRNGVSVSLRPVGGSTSINSRGVTVTGGTAADAAFDLTGVAAGTYDVVVTQGGIERVIAGGLHISSAAAGAKIITTVAGPGVNRVGFPYFAAITARNTGAADAVTPVITVTGPGLPADLSDPDNPFYGYDAISADGAGRDFYFAIPPTGNPSILPAGRSAEAFIAQGITPDGRFTVNTNIVQVGDTTPYDIAALGTSITPDPKPTGWDDIWAIVATGQPQTLGGLSQLTANAADVLYRQSGFRSNDVVAILRNYVGVMHRASLSQVSGRVRWLETTEQTPLGGIEISLLAADNTIGAVTTTMDDGTFAFPPVAPGTYDWHFDGAFPAAAFSPLVVQMGATLSGIEMPIFTGASAHLRVLPVAGVSFNEVLVTLSNPGIPLTVSATPDALGNVTLRGLVDETYTLSVVATGYPPIVQEIVMIELNSLNDLGSVQFTNSVGTVTGRVVRADTLAPLASAVVSIVGTHASVAVTNAQGDYVLDAVPAGTWTVRARAAGFAPAEVASIAVQASGQATANLSLAPGGSVSGTVTSNGIPVDSALVDVAIGTTVLSSAVTDASGQYTLADLPAAVFTVRTHDGRFAGTSTSVTVTAGSNATVNLALVTLPSLRGTVRYTGNALAGQFGIRLVNAPEGAEYTVTNPDGQFELRGLSAGNYVWSFADGGRRTPFTVAADGTTSTSLNVVVSAGEIVGRVVAADGATPVTSVVRLVAGGQVVSTTGSDTDGRYRFSLVTPGTYSIHPCGIEQFFSQATDVVVAAGVRTTVPDLTAGASTLEVAMTLASSGAAPTGFAAVILERSDMPPRLREQVLRQAGVGGIVRFSGLTPGAYRIRGLGLGTASDQVTIHVGAGVNGGTLALASSGYLAGRIVDGSAAPIHGITVVVYRAGTPSITWIGNTDAMGNYTVGALPPGDYTLQVADRRGTVDASALIVPAAQTFTLAGGGSVTRDFTLATSTITITGAATAADGSYPFVADVSLINAAGVEILRRPVSAAGAFTMPAPVAGAYSLRLEALAFTATDLSVTVGASAVTANIAATWTGGAAQLASGNSPFSSREGPPTMAFGFGDAYDWLVACKESLQNTIEEMLIKPPPPAPDKHAPSILKDPCYSCPAANAYWQQAARFQQAANTRYEAWQDSYYARLDQVAGDVGLFGVAVAKVAQGLLMAELEAVAFVGEMGKASIDAAARVQALSKPGADLLELHRAVEVTEFLASVRRKMEALTWTTTATTAYGLSETSAGDTKLALFYNSLSSPSTYASRESLYNLGADIYGIGKGLLDVLTLLPQLRSALEASSFSGPLKRLDSMMTAFDAIYQGIKVLRTAYNTMMDIDTKKHDYQNAIDRRDRAYNAMILAIPDCECAGGETCGCEPPPPKPPGPKPPKPPGGPSSGTGNGRGDAAHDPNAKYTIGYLDAGYVRPDEPLIYTVTFENVATAGLPAQRVIVTDQFDAKLDWSTFELLACGFNRTTIVIPPGLQRYTTRATVATDPNPVRVDLRLNPATGRFTIELRSVDAVTGGFPRDSLAGFLPPNDAQHRGEGFVTFMVKPKPAQPDGTQIRNLASIVFDTNDAIVTNETVNTLDATPPRGRVTTLATRSGNSFTVSWSGTDLGSGAVAYDVWVSRNNGPWELWQRDVTTTSATFSGANGSTYRFFATARDGVGWSDVPSFSPDTSTLVGLGSRLANISTRGPNGAGNNAMIVGFVVNPGANPATAKNLLIRGIGPTLGAFGVSGTLADPQLQLYNSAGAAILSNDDWGLAGNAAQLPAEFGRLGAFGLNAGSRDAAILTSLAPGIYTARIAGAGDSTGVTLVEAYDADSTLEDSSLPQIMNLSTRGFIGTGDDLLIAGFVISGDSPKTLLIRAVGPTLGADPFNLPGVITDPRIRLADNTGATVLENDDWSLSPDPVRIVEVTQRVGAFGLPASSKDAVIVITLPPGSYTALISGANNGTGLAIVELYDADP